MSQTSSPGKDRLRRFSKDQAKLVKLLLEAQSKRSEEIHRYPRDESHGRPRMPVSWAQQRLWFIDQLEGSSTAYHIAVALRLKGNLNEAALQLSLDALILRHEMLRTVFVSQEGDVKQEIGFATPFELARTDLSSASGEQQLIQIRQQQTEALHRPFNLRAGPLIRGNLLLLRPQEYVLLLTIHHIAADGWSLGVMLDELQGHYTSFHRGDTATVEPMEVQYGDYAQWQREWLRDEVLEEQLSYWKRQLEGAPPQIELPTDRPRPAVQSYRGENAKVVIDAALTAKLKSFAQRYKVTLFMALYAGWTCLLSRLSGQQDVVIGTPVANRQRPELERLIGFFVNTLVLRVDIDPQLSVAEHLERVKAATVQAYEHQDVPFEQVVERLQPQRSLSRNPLFQVMFALQNAPAGELKFPQLEVTLEGGVDEPAMFDLLVSLYERGGQVVGSINYAADLFDRVTIERWIECFNVLLESLVDETVVRLSDLHIIPNDERELVLRTLNATGVVYPREKLVHELFEEQVVRTPDTVAVEYEGRTLTYAQLNSRANRLGRYLREKGVGPDRPVAVCFERGLEMIVGVLGALKAGGAYLPLDPNYPAERLEQMVEDASPPVLLTQQALRAKVPRSAAEVIELDGVDEQIATHSDSNLSAGELGLRSDHLVYVIYTSGSTGRPKGTGMAHRSMINLIEWHRREFAGSEGKRVLQFAALSFDVAFQETFSTLCLGGTLVLVGEWIRRDARALSEYLSAQRIQRLFVPPLMLQSVAESSLSMGQVPQQLEDVITAGEQLRISDEMRRFFGQLPGCRLHNHYGPTETHVVTALTLSGAAEQWPTLPSIGKPIANTQIYVLDGRGEPVPLGVSGEIYIGGANVARGYLHRTELTGQRFVKDPFGEDGQGRMYKTGDVGRWRADGTIEYLGRNDDQVKIRGFRVELGEIEAQLARQEQVREAAVVAREEASGAKRLVAYYVPRDAQSAPSVEELRTYVKGLLPEHMVPSAFVQLERLPLTPSGKLDRRALPAPEADAYMSREYEAPQGEVEEILAGIWQELLKVERVGRHDNFFELGGHSLLIVQMMERLRRASLAANVRSIYQSTTLADLARALLGEVVKEFEVPPNLIPEGCEKITPQMLTLVQLEPEHIERIEQAVPGGARNIQDIYPLAPLQEGIFFHYLLAENAGDAYVVPMLLTVPSRESLDEFAGALQKVIDRHSALRTAILWEDLPRPVQVVLRKAPLEIEDIELTGKSAFVEQLRERMQPQHQRLDLRRAPLLRLLVASTDEACYAILQVHHIVSDHESLHAAINEAVALLANADHSLPCAVPFRNHVAQAVACAQADDAEGFFRAKLADVREPTAPYGLLDVHGDGTQIGHVDRVLDAALAERLRATARHLGVTSATLFHVAWGLVVAHTSGRDDVVYGTVLLGRLQTDVGAQQVLGMFINTLPLRLSVEGKTTREFVEHTQREILELLNHEQTSLAVAQRCSGIEGTAPLFTTLVNYRWSNVELETEFERAGVTLLAVHSRTNYPITLGVLDKGNDFHVEIEADARIDANRVIEYVCTALHSLVEALEYSPQALAMELPVVAKAERELVLRTFNTTWVARQDDKLIHELFEEQVARTPKHVAVVYEGESATYAELNVRAERLASFLVNQGIGPDRLVGLCVERSVDMVVGLLAILKAGGAYLPLDPRYPMQRLSYMLEHAAPSVLLTQTSLRQSLPPTDARIVALDADWGQMDEVATPRREPRVRPTPRHLAYVIYTSGSTGTPKGVMVEHQGVVNFLISMQRAPGMCVADCLLAVTTMSFDIAALEIFLPLISGAKVVIASRDTTADAEALVDALERFEVTVLQATPAMWQMLVNSGWEGRPGLKAICGGEALTAELAGRLLNRVASVWNLYGPTETTIWSCAREIIGANGDHGAIELIGRPIANTEVYVLDAYLRPVPLGVQGEIYIGGVGVARGYYHRADLTADRFVPDPFSSSRRARMYKTGDLGRWVPKGNLQYLGRNDDQVKIRGFRIELGEIEAQLVTHPDLKEVVVIAREDTPEDKRLIAYVVAREQSAKPSVESLRSHLKGLLPDYMVPSAFVELDRLPLTPSGKWDRRKLPIPDTAAYVSRSYESPEGEVEEILAGIWQDLLDIDRIGRHDNFFAAGGHSLLIVQMMQRLKRVGLAANARSIYQSTTLCELARTITGGASLECDAVASSIPFGCESIARDMLDLVDLAPEHIEHIVRDIPGGAANIQDIYPLTPAQEGMLFHYLLGASDGDTYVVPLLFLIQSKEHVDAFISGLQQVIDRHDALRTAVLWEHLPRAVQVVCRRAPLTVVDIELPLGRAALEELHERMSPERQRLNIRRAPLVGLQMAPDQATGRWYLLMQLHHLLCDNTSLQLMLQELSACIEGKAQELPAPMSYRTYVAHTIERARGDDADAFFRRKLADVDEPTAPFGLLDTRRGAGTPSTARTSLDSDLARRVRLQARRAGVSSATLFHAAWALVVADTSGRHDVVFGSVLMGRLHGSVAAQRAIGMFINTLPLRLPLGGLTATELVERTQREIVELLSREYASLPSAQRCSGVAGGLPLFSALLNYRHGSPDEVCALGLATGAQLIEARSRTNYPLMLSVDEQPDRFEVAIEVDAHLDPNRIVTYVMTALHSLVDALERASQTPALRLTVLPEDERKHVIEAFNQTGAIYPSEKLVHELFEEQLDRTPTATAVVHGSVSLTYAELEGRANQWARLMRSRGVHPGVVVAICMDRSSEMVVALLGVLKAGGAYVPLDPEYPKDRLQQMIDDAAPQLVLASESREAKLPKTSANVLVAERVLGQCRSESDERLPKSLLGLRSDHLVYVIYTSGSTGRPKGTAMPHYAMVNLIEWHRHTFRRQEGCRATQFAALSFDVAFQEIFSTLCTGGALVILDEDTRRDPRALLKLVEAELVERVFIPPLMLQSLAEFAQAEDLQPTSLKEVITAGEQLRVSPEIVRLFGKLDRCELYNHYGPTETHVVTSLALVGPPAEWPHLPPIGRPISNIQIYVLNTAWRLVPIGVVGEIYIGGAGLARGYLHRPELTAERFIADQFGHASNARLYKTGDLGRWRADGVLEYLGRNDDQVKIRGFRIETAEIEARLRSNSMVKDAAVIVRDAGSGEMRLVGYVVPRAPDSLNAMELRNYLADLLPEHMIPSALVVLETLPTTSSGKLNRRALPAPGADAYVRRAFEPPRGNTEVVLARMWLSILPIGRIGRDDNFFELGAHSIHAMRLASLVSNELHAQMPISLVFRYPTVAELARALGPNLVELEQGSTEGATEFEEGTL